MTLPRVFVGTMHTQEGDFQTCVARIRQQKDVEVTHFIVSNLPEKEAHNALWRTWRSERDSHSLFVKVDADTVLVSDDTLAHIHAVFAQNPRVTGLQAPLHDYMTDGLINGLNAFGPSVVFNDTKDELYCDRHVDTNHDVVLRGDDLPACLRPAGLHCHQATDVQAFHYGLHRALKRQNVVMQLLRQAWVRDRDRTRAMALIGAGMSHHFAQNRRFNYADEEFKAAFADAERNYDRLVTDLASG